MRKRNDIEKVQIKGSCNMAEVDPTHSLSVSSAESKTSSPSSLFGGPSINTSHTHIQRVSSLFFFFLWDWLKSV